MESIVKCLLPVRHVTKEWGVVLIDPPTVRQALLLRGLMPYYETETYADRIRAVLQEWLGDLNIWSHLCKLDWEIQMFYVGKILESCDPDFEKPEQKSSDWSKEVNLSALIAEYRYWLNKDVLNEPWPYFLEQAKQLDKLKSEYGMANLAWYAAAKSEEALNSLMERAGYARGVRADTPQDVVDETDIEMQTQNSEGIGTLGQMYAHRYYA